MSTNIYMTPTPKSSHTKRSLADEEIEGVIPHVAKCQMFAQDIDDIEYNTTSVDAIINSPDAVDDFPFTDNYVSQEEVEPDLMNDFYLEEGGFAPSLETEVDAIDLTDDDDVSDEEPDEDDDDLDPFFR